MNSFQCSRQPGKYKSLFAYRLGCQDLMRVMGIQLLQNVPVFQIYENPQGEVKSERDVHLVTRKAGGEFLDGKREFIERDFTLKAR